MSGPPVHGNHGIQAEDHDILLRDRVASIASTAATTGIDFLPSLALREAVKA